MKPPSYPFLNIARNSGCAYADVLAVADSVRLYGYAAFNPGVDPDTRYAIIEATEEQEAIRSGLIDWQTGKAR